MRNWETAESRTATNKLTDAGAAGNLFNGIIMYVNFIFQALFFGYAIGAAPVVSYHYGAGNREELRNLFLKSLVLMGNSGLVMLVLAEGLNAPLVRIFAGYDQELFSLTCRGFRIYAAAFLMMGVNIWSSAFFTALNNGMVSAVLSLLRTFLFQTAAVILLPVLWGIDGIWMAIVAAEGAALAVSVFFFGKERGRYQYL